MVLQHPLPHHPLPSRDTLRKWFAEVGYLYLIVIAFVLVAFLATGLLHARGAWGPGTSRTPSVVHLDPYPPEAR